MRREHFVRTLVLIAAVLAIGAPVVSAQTLKLFISDMIKSVTLGALIGLPLVWVILTLMDRAGDLWWLYAWFVWSGFQLLMLVLYPTVIAPMFNKFTPLADDSLRSRIENLMQRVGFASKGLFVMDGSKRSAHGNAYFSGFGAAKRIVFFDTLLARLAPHEIEAVTRLADVAAQAIEKNAGPA